MRHLVKLKKLNRTSSHRKAMIRNMIVSLFRHEQIKTTLPKAKVIKPLVERLITKARKTDLATRRYIISELRDKEIVAKLINDIAPRNASRNGGYTRIMKAGFRTGDVAPMAVIELVEKSKAAPKATKKASSKNTTETPVVEVAEKEKNSSKVVAKEAKAEEVKAPAKKTAAKKPAAKKASDKTA